MKPNYIRLRRLVEGCALVAFPKWQRTGVRAFTIRDRWRTSHIYVKMKKPPGEPDGLSISAISLIADG